MILDEPSLDLDYPVDGVRAVHGVGFVALTVAEQRVVDGEAIGRPAELVHVRSPVARDVSASGLDHDHQAVAVEPAADDVGGHRVGPLVGFDPRNDLASEDVDVVGQGSVLLADLEVAGERLPRRRPALGA